MQSTECLGRKDKILAELIQLTCSCREEQLAIVESSRHHNRHGDKASFLGWKWSFWVAVRAISKPLYEGLKKIEDNMNQDFRKSRLSIEDLERSDQAYTLLALLCKDGACAYQAWQALLRARQAWNVTNLLNQLLEPIFTSPNPRINIRQWNKNAEEYATRTGVRVSDGIRKAVYMNKIAPQG